MRDRILSFLSGYILDRGYPPSVREIAKAVDRSLSTVHYHLTMLEAEGRIVRAPRRSRALRVVEVE